MKALIVCSSLTGNTKIVADLIQENLEVQYECNVHIATPKEKSDISKYDLVLLGSYTWNLGELPIQMKKYLRLIFVERETKVFPQFAVFGTGDTQWGGEDLKNYCRAVDALYYYCEKYANKPISKLKIEQSPVSKHQKEKIFDFVDSVMKGMS